MAADWQAVPGVGPVDQVEVCSREGSGADAVGVKGKEVRRGCPLPIRLWVVRSTAGSRAEPRPKNWCILFVIEPKW